MVTFIGFISALDNMKIVGFCESVCEKKRCNTIPDQLDMEGFGKESGVTEGVFL